KVWFSYPKRLIGREAEDMEDAIGYTEFSSLLEMDACGLIENNNSIAPSEPIQIAPCKPVIKKTVPRIRTSKKCDTITKVPDLYVDYKMDGAEERSIKRAKKLFEKMEDALGDVTNISQYMNKYDETCIRTLKVSEVHYLTSRHNYKSAASIRLSGKWLEKVGFQIGDSIQIVAINGMLLIVPVALPFAPHELDPENSWPAY
ncbi:SymE family type I addiction module toxin, partial [Niastella koreensis]